jgi:hypothetical protein
MKGRYYSVLLVLVPVLAGANSETAWRGPDQAVYVVTQNHYAEGFAPDGQTAKFGELLAIEIYNPVTAHAEEAPLYKVGENISLFSGGEKRGVIKIERVVPLQCDSSTAVVSAETPIRFAKETMALATNSSNVLSHANLQRQATDKEKMLAKHLAMAEFRKHGIPDRAENDIQIERAVATKISQSESELLIGNFSVKAGGAEHDLFLISKLDDSGPSTEMARYHKMADLLDGTDYEGYVFVDQLDLDGDGVDEIVVEMTAYESEEFRVIKRINGVWTRVHVGGAGGC